MNNQEVIMRNPASTPVTSSPVPPVALIGINDSPMPQRLTAEQCNKWHHAVRPARREALVPNNDLERHVLSRESKETLLSGTCGV